MEVPCPAMTKTSISDDQHEGVQVSTSTAQETAGTAKDQAAQAAGTAKDEAAQTAGTARDEAAQTAGVARDQVAHVGQHAASAATDVAATAKDQAASVAGEALDQVKDLGSQVSSQLSEQAGTAAAKLGEVVRSLAHELGSMTQHDGDHGAATQAARQLSERGHRLADYLEGRDPDTLLADLRRSAAHRPGRFLLGAVVAGVLAGRIVRSTRDAKSDDTVSAIAPVPAPVYSAPAPVFPADIGVLPVPTAVSVGSEPVPGSWEASRAGFEQPR